MGLMSIGKFAKEIGVSQLTLRRMQETGELVPAHISKGGTRYYSTEQLNQFLNGLKSATCNQKVIGYCRVSTPSQKDDLQTQIENVKLYMCAKGYQFEIIEDVGSGINYKKKGLQTLFDKIVNNEVSKIVVLYRDRLMRFGFEMFEYFCHLHGVQIEIIDNIEYSKEQELTDDLIQIITVFASRLYGSRSKKTKKLLEDIKSDGFNQREENTTERFQ